MLSVWKKKGNELQERYVKADLFLTAALYSPVWFQLAQLVPLLLLGEAGQITLTFRQVLTEPSSRRT